MRRFVPALTLALLVGAGFALRWRVVGEFHAPAGDGHEYHRLAHELRRAGRYAYGPEPAPLSIGRMPGYPVLLTALERAEPNDIEAMLVRGTHLNVVFDLLSSLLVFFICLEAGLGAAAAWTACALTVFCPLLILDACYLLRESFATTLNLLTIYLLVRAHRRRNGALLVAAGGLAGLTMLVRFDALAVGAAFLVPLAALVGWRRRVGVAALALGACLAAFSPWMIRNQLRFGDPHPWGATWPDPNGNPFPTGVRAWMRTWIDDLHQGWTNLRLTHRLPVGERDILPAAWSSEAEKQELLALFARYNREGLSPSVDQAFRDLARRRIREHPLRALVWLPLRRAAIWWYQFTPYEEQPLRSATLGQPQLRYLFDWYSHGMLLIGGLGLIAMAVNRRSVALAAMFALALVSRTLLMSFASPDGCQRYLAPVYPLLLIAAAVLLTGLGPLASRLARRESDGRAVADTPIPDA